MKNLDCLMKDNYSFGVEEIDAINGGIKKGSNLLLIGPPMSGKEIISNHIIRDNVLKYDDAVLIVTTTEPGINILEKFRKLVPNLNLSKLGLVDCISLKYGSIAVENENIRLVNGPDDLTAIGVKISQFLEDFYMKKKIQKIQLHINSLSTLLMYSNIQTVFRFLHVLTGRIKMANALGIYVMESEMHDKQVITAIKLLCDGMIEIKSENDKNFIRTICSEPTQWLEYQIEKDNIKILPK